MKILLVSTGFEGGGAERAARELFLWHRAQGHQVSMLVARPPRSPIEGVRPVRLPGEKYLRVFEPRGAWADWRHIGSRLTLRRITRQDFDLVHLHNIHSSWISLKVLQQLARRIPTVWTLHDEWPIHITTAYDLSHAGQPAPTINKLYQQVRGLLPRPEFVISPSAYLCQLIAADPLFRGIARIQLPYGLTMLSVRERHAPRDEAKRAFGLTPGAPTVLLVAADFNSPYKGTRLALAALEQLKLPTAELLLVGSSPPDFKTPLHVIRTGFISDPARLALAFRAGDVLLMPSIADNFPYVVLEALSCSLPIAGFDIGGIAEQLGHGQRGLLAPCPDATAMADNLRTLLLDPSRASTVAAAGRQWVEQACNFDAYGEATLNAYKKAIARFDAPLENDERSPGDG